jgi:RNA polymerase sigma-70 factor (ECF subfamily)
MTSDWTSGDDVDDAPAGELDELLAATALGDRQAFSALYDGTAPRVFGLIRRLLVNAAQAEEVAQEVSLEVWQSAARFDPNRGRALTWLLTMAHRRAVDRIRASQAARDRDTAVGIRDLPTAYDQVAEAVEVRVEHERAEAAMSVLSEAQREAVMLAYFAGLTQSEVAERLGIPWAQRKLGCAMR